MTRNNRIALLVLAAGAVWAVAVPACAQVTTSRMIKTKPVHTAKVNTTKTRFEVLHMTNTAIQVRSLVNELEIHTFKYSDSIRDKMQKLLDHGGYQYGDKVYIRYQPGTDIALEIKGKPSKPL
jgi:hypothetical protein